MDNNPLKLVIVGHVDHGKSTLIGRLMFDTDSLPAEKVREIEESSRQLGREVEFAFLTDHFKEEREKSMTIDTAQIFFKTKKRNYVIIDAPGHVEFIQNMITGAAHANIGVLVVSAKEGIQEQTQRHAYLLKILGINNLIVVINKMDALNYSQSEFNELKRRIEEILFLVDLRAIKIIPISAKKGDNIVNPSTQMPWYREATLLESLDDIKLNYKGNNDYLRFPVQDIYHIKNKNIIVGRVESGELRKTEALLVLPSLRRVTIESINKFGQRLNKAAAGDCIGIITDDSSHFRRGEVICEERNQPSVCDRFKANIFWISDKPLHLNQTLTFKCVTQEALCQVEKIERKFDSSTLQALEDNSGGLEFTQIGKVVIRTLQPVVIDDVTIATNLERFVLESNHNTVAGGTISL